MTKYLQCISLEGKMYNLLCMSIIKIVFLDIAYFVYICMVINIIVFLIVIIIIMKHCIYL